MLLYTPQGHTRSLPNRRAAASMKRGFSRKSSIPSTRESAVAQSARKFGSDDHGGRSRLRAHLGAALEVALHRKVGCGALEQLPHEGGPVERLGQEDRSAAGGGHGAEDSAGACAAGSLGARA